MSVRSIRLKIGIHTINELQQICEIHLARHRNPVQLCEIHCLKVEILYAHATQLFVTDIMSQMLSAVVSLLLFVLYVDFSFTVTCLDVDFVDLDF